MVTGSLPARATPSRLAIRMASTTPWQYPRGVIRTTSTRSSLRGGFDGTVEPKGSATMRIASREQQPRVQKHPDATADGELETAGQRARRHEGFERPGDDEQARGPEHEHHRSHGNSCERLASA